MTAAAGQARVAIRPAERADVPAIARLIRELASYERSAGQVTATEQDLHAALFATQPAAYAHVAVAQDEAARDEAAQDEVVGFALWFLSFSTWSGRHGIYLEDLYVTPAMRGSGIGRALLGELAAICARRGYGRLEWSVLDWNSPAIAFYHSNGAVAMDEWTVYRLTGQPLADLAARALGERGGG